MTYLRNAVDRLAWRKSCPSNSSSRTSKKYMLSRLLSHPLVQLAIAMMVALGVVVSVFPHFIPQLSWAVNYAVLLMLFYLAAGMVFLFLQQPRLTFICFAGCALLCFFLKYSVKSNTIERWRQMVIKDRMPPVQDAPEVEFRAVHLNVTNTADASDLLNTLRQSNADLVSFHEVTPDWGRLLQDSLAASYPFHHDMVDIGLFGMAIFSRFQLTDIDTFYYEEIPNLRGCVDVEGEKFCFMSVHTEPALNTFSLQRLREHLGMVATEVRKMEMPVIVMGDFNSVSWSSEMQIFMDSSGLLESRRGFMPYSNGGTSSFFDIPLDHIFFSPRLYCNGFEVLKSKAAHRLGILGNYSFKPLATHAKKTAQ